MELAAIPSWPLWEEEMDRLDLGGGYQARSSVDEKCIDENEIPSTKGSLRVILSAASIYCNAIV